MGSKHRRRTETLATVWLLIGLSNKYWFHSWATRQVGTEAKAKRGADQRVSREEQFFLLWIKVLKIIMTCARKSPWFAIRRAMNTLEYYFFECALRRGKVLAFMPYEWNHVYQEVITESEVKSNHQDYRNNGIRSSMRRIQWRIVRASSIRFPLSTLAFVGNSTYSTAVALSKPDLILSP